MANYVYPAGPITFGTRDGLPPNDPDKVVKGMQLDFEFNELAQRSADKLDKTGNDFAGTIDGGTY